jgi:hypothetical protein
MILSHLEIGTPTYNRVFRCDSCGRHERIAITLVRAVDPRSGSGRPESIVS